VKYLSPFFLDFFEQFFNNIMHFTVLSALSRANAVQEAN